MVLETFVHLSTYTPSIIGLFDEARQFAVKKQLPYDPLTVKQAQYWIQKYQTCHLWQVLTERMVYKFSQIISILTDTNTKKYTTFSLLYYFVGTLEEIK